MNLLMLQIIFLPHFIQSSIPSRLSSSNITPLHSFTAFVAVFPNAIPTAAYLKDRASLLPSPT